MRRASLIFTLGAALSLLSAPAAMAMGFGRTVTATTLGQRLNFLAQLSLESDETLARECVGAEVLIGDNRVAAENVRVTLESARETGELRIRVTTRSVVDEPVVTIDLRVGCRSQMTRRFVAFVDPPMLHLANADADDSLAPQRVDPKVTPLLDIVRAADSSRRRIEAEGPGADGDAVAAPRHAARRTAPGRRFAAATMTRTIAPRSAAPASARAVARADLSGGRQAGTARAAPRLRLDAAAAFVRPAPSRVAAAGTAAPVVAAIAATPAAESRTAAAPAPPPDVDTAATALAGEPARIQELEAGLARLRSDSQAQQRTLGALQARLRQAEGDRYANGLVYTLAGGLVFFALLAAAFWALRPRQRRRARWFDAQAHQQRRSAVAAPSVASARPAAAEARSPEISQPPSQWRESAHGILPVTAPATIGGLEVTTVLAPQSHYARMAEAGGSANGPESVAAARMSSPSMEELIDLEQQAEFYVVLGQDEAAIALLTAHLRETGGASPLPFLQLLEIHQRRGDRASYEQVRQGYQKHFDAFAPEWSSDLHFGRSLEAYPQTIARLQALWATPLHAMQTLDGLLFRRSEADDAFDFPAYRELLFLYSIARELAGQVETDFGTIDLFLPLEDARTEPSPHHEGKFAIDLDVSGWPDDAQSEGLVIRRSVSRRGAS
jgi:hypothetical protein